jgi:chemotaxis signal transduction protein
MNGIDLTNELDAQMAEDADVIQLVGLKLGYEEYAIDVLKIQEIIRTVEITIVPRSEQFVLGVMNLRGKVIPVIDLRVRFNLEKTDFDKSTRVIVVRFEKEQIGFVVDEVTQVIRIEKNMVEPTPPLVGAIGQEYILGICKFNERLIILLDIDRVVGEDTSESTLRKRILETKDKSQHIKTNKATPRKKEAVIATEKLAGELKKYSMADEVDATAKPVITESPTDSMNEVLNDVATQTRTVSLKSSSLVEQHELDNLFDGAVDNKHGESAAKIQEAEENALSIEDLIAIELAKREAETEELNKKRREESSKEEEKKK